MIQNLNVIQESSTQARFDSMNNTEGNLTFDDENNALNVGMFRIKNSLTVGYQTSAIRNIIIDDDKITLDTLNGSITYKIVK